jgi:hypothetical protein
MSRIASSNEHVDEMTNDEGVTKGAASRIDRSGGRKKAAQDSGLRQHREWGARAIPLWRGLNWRRQLIKAQCFNAGFEFKRHPSEVPQGRKKFSFHNDS